MKLKDFLPATLAQWAGVAVITCLGAIVGGWLM